jgi:hypothetical protein
VPFGITTGFIHNRQSIQRGQSRQLYIKRARTRLKSKSLTQSSAVRADRHGRDQAGWHRLVHARFRHRRPPPRDAAWRPLLVATAGVVPGADPSAASAGTHDALRAATSGPAAVPAAGFRDDRNVRRAAATGEPALAQATRPRADRRAPAAAAPGGAAVLAAVATAAAGLRRRRELFVGTGCVSPLGPTSPRSTASTARASTPPPRLFLQKVPKPSNLSPSAEDSQPVPKLSVIAEDFRTIPQSHPSMVQPSWTPSSCAGQCLPHLGAAATSSLGLDNACLHPYMSALLTAPGRDAW